ncbi:RagB/SusD family nutrient uptake outer membrane protein [Pontibacter harenae]|uniref:RagB/SusD family nutrient uptake outer membrane protein n=1 Tax=Pontibacter harenae TaxID=2894083 RepID=UPI001E2B4DDA|nr:RagB/SusD family nutrient uptake outer membrane protein [Pontibacter harenae]MCC9168187.1 RagB/SusD family nutrient uptake outer membrane protein [Pontibacter harenae]
MIKDNILSKISRLNEATKKPSLKGLKSKRGSRYLKCILLLVALNVSSCKDYLDVVPDNVATIENAFKLRNEAEKYLFTCYSFLPKNGDGWYNVGMFAGDEMWLPQASQAQWHAAFRIAQGQQNKDAPLFDEWSGLRKGGGNGWEHLKMFRGIRHCNIFLENIKDENKVPDLTIDERERWIGEVEFLKAFYHFYLFRMYGPIPIMDENSPIAEPNAVRQPVDDVVTYISDLLDESVKKLPPRIVDENSQLGRITQPIALAVKAKLWLFAASPLFNGNTDYAGFANHDGTVLFNRQYDQTKWVKARDAAKAAIEAAEANGHFLYTYKNDVLQLSDEIKTQLNIRNAVTGRWGPEAIWALSNSYMNNEFLAMPPVERSPHNDRGQTRGAWAAPLKIAKMFYTKNGVPIEEDKTLDYSDYMAVRTAEMSERYYIEPTYRTARLNFDREPRFYASLGFDGSIWYMKDGNATGADENTFYIRSKNSEKAGFGDYMNWNETGYFIKKLVHWESTTNSTSAPAWKGYPWPEIRLADLYLMYAEALNETGEAAEAIVYVDKLRERAGLKGVAESWSTYSKNPAKFTNQNGLREIIQQERLIELAFEGHRFWDLRRWKLAGEELNKDITGLNITSKTTEGYNSERVVFSQKFIVPRDYLWPIGNFDTRRNPNLVENPGW